MSKILIIDDDEVILALASEVLSAHGHNVLTAAEGEAGISLARTERPDVIVVDLLMPKVHGYRIVEQIRRVPELEQSRIILSSLHTPDTTLGFFVSRYLKKPYDLDALVQMVAEVVNEADIPP